MKKNKPKKKNGKRLAQDAIKQHEPLIQDRIAGMTIKELAEKYKLHRDTVSAICTEHKERIEKERDEYLEERQERIRQAIDKETEATVRLIGKHSRILERFADLVDDLLDTYAEIKKMPDAPIIFEGWKGAIKGRDRLHASILAQQKEASSE